MMMNRPPTYRLRRGAAARALLGLVWLALAPPTPPACAQEGGSLAELAAAHAQTLESVAARRQNEHAAALDQYGAYLEMAMRLLQQRGDLEGYLAIEREQGAFAQSRAVPAADEPLTHPHVATGRAACRAARANADARHAATLKDAWTRHAAQLDALKRQLTRQGRIPDAMAASEALARAQAALAQLTAPATAASSATTTPCPRCQGGGKAAVACVPCSGLGRCRQCQGTGRRPNPMKGATAPVTCLSCKGTGKCGACGGTGRGAATGPCAACGGTGAVQAPSTPAMATTPAIRPAPGWAGQPTDSRSISSEAAGRELQAYVQAMDALRDKFERETPETADAGAVAAAPTEYVGRLLESRVNLVSAFARNVTVAPSRGDTRTLSLIPYTKERGLAAQTLLRAQGTGAAARIVYGVVNDRNLTLFQIDPAE